MRLPCCHVESVSLNLREFDFCSLAAPLSKHDVLFPSFPPFRSFRLSLLSEEKKWRYNSLSPRHLSGSLSPRVTVGWEGCGWGGDGNNRQGRRPAHFLSTPKGGRYWSVALSRGSTQSGIHLFKYFIAIQLAFTRVDIRCDYVEMPWLSSNNFPLLPCLHE